VYAAWLDKTIEKRVFCTANGDSKPRHHSARIDTRTGCSRACLDRIGPLAIGVIPQQRAVDHFGCVAT